MIWVFDSHLSTYGHLCLVEVVSLVPCYFVMNVRKLRIAPSRVAVGQLASQYGVVRAIWMRGVLVGLSLVVPSFASVSAVYRSVRVLCVCRFCVGSNIFVAL